MTGALTPSGWWQFQWLIMNIILFLPSVKRWNQVMMEGKASAFAILGATDCTQRRWILTVWRGKSRHFKYRINILKHRSLPNHTVLLKTVVRGAEIKSYSITFKGISMIRIINLTVSEGQQWKSPKCFSKDCPSKFPLLKDREACACMCLYACYLILPMFSLLN